MSDNAIQKIKEKLDLVEFLRSYLELRPAGNNLKAICPFHKEKTPSLMVSAEKQIWHCFGCNEGGDIFKFIMKYENIEFYEALKLLAEKANVSLSRISPSDHKEFGILYDINRVAVDYYRECLTQSPIANEYLKARKLSTQSIEEFEIGFAPNDFDGLTVYLVKKGFDITDAVRAGLVFKTEKGKYIDRFRGRIMFPLESGFGKVIGFTGRVLPQFDTGDMGKYVNSPETPIFSKSRLLYGLSKSKDGIREAGFVLLVEGQMDVMMSHQDGVKNAVGTSGTALTEEQLTTLKRYATRITLNFDNDEAGRRAMERSIDLARVKDFEVEILDLNILPETEGLKDPADIVTTKPGLLKDIINKSVPAMRYYMDRHPISGVEIGIKKQNIREILKKIINIPSAVERAHWLKELSFQSGVREADLFLEINFIKEVSPSQTGRVSHSPVIGTLAKKDKISRKEIIAKRLLSLYFVSDSAKTELERVRAYLPQTELGLYNALVSDLAPQDVDIRQKIAELTLKSGTEGENIEREILELADNLEMESLAEERDALSVEIKSDRLSEEERSEKSLALIEIAKAIETIKLKKRYGK